MEWSRIAHPSRAVFLTTLCIFALAACGPVDDGTTSGTRGTDASGNPNVGDVTGTFYVRPYTETGYSYYAHQENVTTAEETYVATAATDSLAVADSSLYSVGQEVTLRTVSGTMPTKLYEKTSYFVTQIDTAGANTIQLGATYAAAQAGTAIDFTGNGAGTLYIRRYTYSGLLSSCEIPAGTTGQSVNCIVEGKEADLWYYGAKLQYNVPNYGTSTSACAYLVYMPYYYHKMEPGRGPSTLEITYDQTAKTYAWTTGSNYPELAIDSTTGTITCPAFNHSLVDSTYPNCCAGKYIVNMTQANITAPPTAATVANGTYGGTTAACLAGPAMDTQTKTSSGWPESTIIYVGGVGVNALYSINPPRNKSTAGGFQQSSIVHVSNYQEANKYHYGNDIAAVDPATENLNPENFIAASNIIHVRKRTYTTGQIIYFDPSDTAVLAGTGISASTQYFVRRVSNTTITLHPTYTDAAGNINPIDITAQPTAAVPMIYLRSAGYDTTPAYIFQCYDRAFELINEIKVSIRDWDLNANFDTMHSSSTASYRGATHYTGCPMVTTLVGDPTLAGTNFGCSAQDNETTWSTVHPVDDRWSWRSMQTEWDYYNIVLGSSVTGASKAVFPSLYE